MLAPVQRKVFTRCLTPHSPGSLLWSSFSPSSHSNRMKRSVWLKQGPGGSCVFSMEVGEVHEGVGRHFPQHQSGHLSPPPLLPSTLRFSLGTVRWVRKPALMAGPREQGLCCECSPSPAQPVPLPVGLLLFSQTTAPLVLQLRPVLLPLPSVAGNELLRRLDHRWHPCWPAPSDPHQTRSWQLVRSGDGRLQLRGRRPDSHGHLPNR